jgi:DNA-binding XRE family transcriptional regulator
MAMGKELKDLRLEYEWRRPTAAKITGVPQTTIYNIENNQHTMSFCAVVQLSEGYRICPVNLITA